MSAAKLPGVPLTFGFDNWRPSEEVVPLSPEARQRVLDKIAAVQHARAVAMVSSQFYVVGAGSSIPGDTP